MKKLYCAYGSNLCLDQMARRCPTAKIIDKGAVSGYQLIFRGSRGSAVATIEPTNLESKVPVLVWSITKKDEEALDRYEGYPNLYRKENVFVITSNGERIKVMVYIMNPRYSENAPSVYYYNIIRDGYETAGFDTEYLHKAVLQSSEVK